MATWKSAAAKPARPQFYSFRGLAVVFLESGAVTMIRDAGKKNPIISVKAVPSGVRLILSP